MMSELKPCPFCGEIDDLTRWQDIVSGEGEYLCTSCGATGPIGEGPEIGDKWNTRTPDPRVMSLVEAAKWADNEFRKFSESIDPHRRRELSNALKAMEQSDD